ncbi:MAG: phospholipase [Microbacterium sp.]|uniref:aggregation-promoting factor C-terminal-like domain-containing protein n=1 Tax=Microbacterium sp. TaxID=51671 RepID=UPI0039E6BA96
MRPRTSSFAAHTSAAHPAPSPRLLATGLAFLAAVAVLIGLPASAQAQTDPGSVTPRTVDADAAAAVATATAASTSASGKVDTTQLSIQIAQLDDTEDMNEIAVSALTAQLEATTASTTDAVAAYDAAQAAAEAAAAALAAANTPAAAQATARQMAADDYGWGDSQFQCLLSLWNRESSWNFEAYNSSGAYGIPQALPGSKMASAGSDWRTNAVTQIAWGLAYIDGSYGSPCSAWAHSESYNWY